MGVIFCIKNNENDLFYYHCRAALCAVIMLLASAQNWVQVSCVMPIFQ